MGGGRAIADVERSQGGGGEADEDVEAADGKDGPSCQIFFCRRPEGVLADEADGEGVADASGRSRPKRNPGRSWPHGGHQLSRYLKTGCHTTTVRIEGGVGRR